MGACTGSEPVLDQALTRGAITRWQFFVVGYSDRRVPDWGVREAGWPVCGHGVPVGAGRSYPGPPWTHWAAVLRRVGHQAGSSAGIRRTFPRDGRVLPGVVSWADG